MFFTYLLVLTTTLFYEASALKLGKHSHRLSYLPHNNAKALTARSTLNGEPSTSGTSYFTQYIDHNNSALGTFQQQYYWNIEFWGGEGYPIILFAGQEADLNSYGSWGTSNESLAGAMAQEIGAAVIAIEHRYWGNSSPFHELTTTNLQYLTVTQNIADLTHFASIGSLPFSNSSSATDVPWILVGPSYSAAVTAWTAAIAPGTFWAYFASSAVVEAISEFWQYFEIIAQYAPQNCSTDLNRVWEYVDDVLENGSESDKDELKSMFGLQDVEHDQDFVSALVEPLFAWQSNQPDSASLFFSFCDAIENVTSSNMTLPSINGVGLTTALAGYAAYWNAQYSDTCSGYGYDFDSTTACFDSFNASSPIYTDTRVDNSVNRQWQWILCNEPLSWSLDGAPDDQTTIVSRLLNSSYQERQCSLYFPTEGTNTVGVAAGKTPAEWNTYTQGWSANMNTTAEERLFYVNGEMDPWRGATVSSPWRPGGSQADSATQRVMLIEGGFHCSDWDMYDAVVSEAVATVLDEEMRQLVEWVGQWPKGDGPAPPSSTSSITSVTTSASTSTSATLTTSTSTTSSFPSSSISTTSTTFATSTLPTSSTTFSTSTFLTTPTPTFITRTMTGDIVGISYSAQASASVGADGIDGTLSGTVDGYVFDIEI